MVVVVVAAAAEVAGEREAALEIGLGGGTSIALARQSVDETWSAEWAGCAHHSRTDRPPCFRTGRTYLPHRTCQMRM